ncbi:hypothetical protein C8R47DRAFT_658673 [Mycena vitilis]|nr:hypothetical protein C8R47DRAFT_658673 [Mycena vitilis]
MLLPSIFRRRTYPPGRWTSSLPIYIQHFAAHTAQRPLRRQTRSVVRCTPGLRDDIYCRGFDGATVSPRHTTPCRHIRLVLFPSPAGERSIRRQARRSGHIHVGSHSPPRDRAPSRPTSTSLTVAAAFWAFAGRVCLLGWPPMLRGGLPQSVDSSLFAKARRQPCEREHTRGRRHRTHFPSLISRHRGGGVRPQQSLLRLAGCGERPPALRATIATASFPRRSAPTPAYRSRSLIAHRHTRMPAGQRTEDRPIRVHRPRAAMADRVRWWLP